MGNTKLHIGIIGAGTMGTGIAQLCASSGYHVNLFDVNQNILPASLKKIHETLINLASKGKFHNNEIDTILSRIKLVDELPEFSECGLIIEAVAEDINIKRELFKKIESIVSDECILASNTSSLSITSIASGATRPGKIIGTHFFNPAPVMKLVEIVPGLLTSPECTGIIREIITSLNKLTVIAKDTPGFIVNRVARPFYGEALRILEEGIADHITIDWAMKEIGGFKMGPFELMDLIGNDINYKVTETVFSEMYYDPKFKPALTQKRMIEAGLLGKKSGRGFYSYTDKNPEPKVDYQKGEEIFERILFMLINEAADMIQFNVAAENDIDTAVKYGLNYPKGLIEWAYDFGIEVVADGINKLYAEYKEDRYRPSAYLKKICLKERKGIS